ncbi:hypothetical protein TFLX_00074 [Thermoflexales bacterium]|nr:hypothetical protein TFLX_00074 [Thermoflexales bacterium]
MTALGFFVLMILFLGGVALCMKLGRHAVASRRIYLSPEQGFTQGAVYGLSTGMIIFMLLLALAVQAVKDSFFLLCVTLPLLSGLFGGLGGVWAAGEGVRGSWGKKAVRKAPQYFGAGSKRDFNWYLQQESAVAARSIDEICSWLQACTYEIDPKQFHTPDYWQHPIEFERTRRGDCEDHALWAWRKLIELGHTAEFMVGKTYLRNPSGDYHAWVVFTRKDRYYLLEAAYKQAQMMAPLEEVQQLYAPDYSVDHQLQTYSYAAVRKPVNL